MSPRIARISWIAASLVTAVCAITLPPDSARAHNCLMPFLTDSADVQNNPVPYDYDVHFTSNSGLGGHSISFMRAGWIRDGLLDSHTQLVAPPYSFLGPSFSGAFPMDTCVFGYNTGIAGDAPANRIRIEASNVLDQPSTRLTMAHELFHHVQYASIPYSAWPGWGTWIIEGMATAIQDKLWFADDSSGGRYLDQVDQLLGNPNVKIFDRSYDSALFWTYLQEQLGTVYGEPERGVDFLKIYWDNANGSLPNSLGVLSQTNQDLGSERNLEELFLDFSITHYTHPFDIQVESWLQDRYRYFDETFAGGGTPYTDVALTKVTAPNTTQSSSVRPFASQHFEADTDSAGSCEAIGYWGDAEGSASLNWAIVGVKNGATQDRVTEIQRGGGNVFYRALINPPTDGYKQLGLVVVGHTAPANFDYAFGTGPVSGNVEYPSGDRPVRVGAIGSTPQRFRTRMLIQGPASLTPPGYGAVSLKGLDPSLFEFTLRSASTGSTYTPTVHNGYYLNGQYVVNMTAPEITNPADGDLYDLEVCLCGDAGAGSCASSIASADSIKYEDEILHEMLVIDRSGSMDYPGPIEASKMEAARNAGRNYIDGTQDDDSLGVVSFAGNLSECSDDATLEQNLTSVPGNRHTLAAAVGGVNAQGSTSIGDGLIKARDHLLATAGPADQLGIVLMSDGQSNEGDYWDDSNFQCLSFAVEDSFDVSIPGIASHIRIDTMAFGADADEGLLEEMALFTEGMAIPVSSEEPPGSPSPAGMQAMGATSNGSASLGAGVTTWPGPDQLEVPNRLADAYRTIAEDTRRQDRLFFAAVELTPGMPETIPISVEEKEGGGIDEATFAINWHLSSPNVTVELRDPTNALITGAATGWGVDSESTNTFYRYANTLSTGIWTVTLSSDASVQATVGLSGKIARGVEIDTQLSQVRQEGPLPECSEEHYQYLRGLPVVLKASVIDSNGGIGGLEVEARVVNAQGSANRLSLYDDGLHEDGVAADGVYANAYTRTPYSSRGGVPDFPLGPPTGQWGSYSVVVTAQGTSNYNETFTRYEQRGFHAHEFSATLGCDPDLDGDGLPDRWEDLYGLDSGDPGDAVLDQDNDGLSALVEFDQGTLPLDPDTDFGGESDGSEVAAGRDPLYNEDDLVPPIRVYGAVTHVYHFDVHRPQSETNILHFPIASAYQTMEVWRRDPADTNFHLEDVVDLTLETTGVHYDTDLQNGSTYEYFLVATGLSGAKTAPTPVFAGTPFADVPPDVKLTLNNGYAVADSPILLATLVTTADTTTDMSHAEISGMVGSSWQTFATSFPVTVASAGPAPYFASYFAQGRNTQGQTSLVTGDSILVDEKGDADGDGDPNDLDSDDDNDGLSDYDEIHQHATDPMNADTDGDSLSDRDEILIYGTNPLEPDSDNDGFSDAVEIAEGTDPLDPSSHPAIPIPTLGGRFGTLALMLGLWSAVAVHAKRERRTSTRL